MEKEIRIPIPEGMEIDKENSTFECIKFKPIEKKRWRDDEDAEIKGYYVATEADIQETDLVFNTNNNYNVFATEKQAKSALAMARISQIMANDERFGGVITDKEWVKPTNCGKYTISRIGNDFYCGYSYNAYHFLAFHTPQQRELFLQENEDLVRDYLMI